MKAGILIIGSLYWDIHGNRRHREEWQISRLQMGDDFPIRAPIRYGRWSKDRKAYTMVFSQLCEAEDKLGTAIVVPCKNPISCVADLVDEAKQLWWAEQSERPQQTDIGLSKNWGCVALLPNPKKPLAADFLAGWSAEVSKQRNQRPYGGLNHADSEEPIVNKGGFLRIEWPTAASASHETGSFDLLLATANDPTVNENKYPDPEAIAKAWIKAPKELRYFEENRKYKITTFEDGSIIKHLSNAGITLKT